MKTIILTAFSLLAASLPAAEPASGKPNVVFFLADDLRPDCLGVLGHSIVKTPNIDKLLENGFREEKAQEPMRTHPRFILLALLQTPQAVLHANV